MDRRSKALDVQFMSISLTFEFAVIQRKTPSVVNTDRPTACRNICGLAFCPSPLLTIIVQCYSNYGPRPGTGPRWFGYRAADCHSNLYSVQYIREYGTAFL